MSAPNIVYPPSSGGGGGGVSGTGTPSRIPIWNGATSLSDSPISFSGSTLATTSALTAINFSAATQTWTLPNNAFALAIQGTSGNATLKLDTNIRYVGVDSPSSPADKLHLAESGALALRMQNTASGTYWQHKVDASGNWGLAVNGGANAVTALAASGNVGIGTASPQAALHVVNNIVSGVGATTTPYQHGLFGSSSAYTMWWRTSATAGGGIVGSSGPGLQFYTASGSSTSPTVSLAATIDSTGNVGIGTASPKDLLHVSNGSIKVGADAINSFLSFGDEGVATRNNGVYRPASSNTLAIGSYNQITFNVSATTLGSQTNRGTIDATQASFTVPVRATGTLATAPAFSTPTDTNTGMYFPSADTLRFATAGSPAMSITSAQVLQFDSGYGSVANAYGCRAWVNFNGTGVVAARASGNVSSVADGGTGVYTVNFTSAMPDSNYAVTASAWYDGVAAGAGGVTSRSTTSVTVKTVATQTAALVDMLECHFSIFR